MKTAKKSLNSRVESRFGICLDDIANGYLPYLTNPHNRNRTSADA